MSANIYKRFNVSDTFVVPYTANKSWDIDSGSFADNRIVVNIGVNKSGSIFDPNTEFITNGQYERLVYNSINLNYYPNFLPTSSHLYLTERQGTAYNDGTLSTQSYYNGFVNPGNLDTVKFFPTASDSVIYVVNIPKTLTSEKILPSTFELYFSSGSTYTAKIYDDGNYNLFYSGSSVASSIGSTLTNGSYIGNVFYEQNVAVLTIIPNAVRLLGWRGANPFCIQTSPSPTPSISVTPSVTPSISVTPSQTPSITPSISITPSVTPSVTPSISATPSISITPSVTPSISITPSETPSVSVTPSISITPSETPSVSVTPSISITPSVTPSTSFNPNPTLTGVFDNQTIGGECFLYPGDYETQQTFYVTFAAPATISGTVRITFVDTSYLDATFGIGDTQTNPSTTFNCGCGVTCKSIANVVSYVVL
jgi:hypothetical protein